MIFRLNFVQRPLLNDSWTEMGITPEIGTVGFTTDSPCSRNIWLLYVVSTFRIFFTVLILQLLCNLITLTLFHSNKQTNPMFSSFC